jgi:hypothetical protein
MHEMSRIHAHSQSTLVCSYQEGNVRECDSCGERGCGPGEVEGDAGDVGAGDQEGAEGEGGALRGEGEEPQEDWVSGDVK